MKYIIATILCCLVSSRALSEWTAISVEDKMTDKEIKVAIGRSSDGHTLHVRRMNDGKVWAFFYLPKDGVHLLESAPQWRIDSYPSESLEDLKRQQKVVGFPMLLKRPNSVGWLVWHGTGALKSEGSGMLTKIINSKKILFRYNTYSGGAVDVEFDMIGAKDSILKSIDAEMDDK